MKNLSSLIHDRTLDEMLKILSNTHRRAILWHFQQSPEDVTTTGHLAKIIARQEGMEVDQTVIQLRHSTLPRLEDAGVIDYDPMSNTVRYLGHSGLEALLDVIMERQAEQTEEVDAN